MKLNKYIILFIIAGMSASLIGLVTVQFFLLRRAIKMTNRTFTQNVNGALNSVVEKLETRETLHSALRIGMNPAGDSLRHVGFLTYTGSDSSTNQKKKLLFKTAKDSYQVQLDGDRVDFRLDKSLRVRLSVVDENDNLNSVLMDEIKPMGSHTILLDGYKLAEDQRLLLTLNDTAYHIFLSQPPNLPLSFDPSVNFDRRLLLDKVLDQVFRFHSVPILDRIDTAVLDSIVPSTLMEFGLQTGCSYGILSVEKDSVIIAEPAHLSGLLRTSSFRTRLFPHDVISSAYDLAFYFPNQKGMLLRTAGPSAVVSLIFILVIIACFIAVLKILFAQHRFSGVLRDFINNMTHEFKTPITTISLAGETLTRSEVMTNQKRLERYSKIIRDESDRMRKQVEKILEMASLEKGDVELDRTDVDIHKLIRKTISNFQIRVKHVKGRVHTDLQASAFTVFGDALHLKNIFTNLLDNALKYTNRSPDIHIQTRNETNGIRISVQDNGIGLSSDQQKRVFDKYYRVPTGNVHNVKGFGLGLSYVKLLVEAHSGAIGVRSSPGEGSVFEIILPASNREDLPE